MSSNVPGPSLKLACAGFSECGGPFVISSLAIGCFFTNLHPKFQVFSHLINGTSIVWVKWNYTIFITFVWFFNFQAKQLLYYLFILFFWFFEISSCIFLLVEVSCFCSFCSFCSFSAFGCFFPFCCVFWFCSFCSLLCVCCCSCFCFFFPWFCWSFDCVCFCPFCCVCSFCCFCCLCSCVCSFCCFCSVGMMDIAAQVNLAPVSVDAKTFPKQWLDMLF